MTRSDIPEDSPQPDQDGETVDMRGAQGPIYKPSGPVEQQFGPRIVITGEGARVTVTMQGENVRDKELAYLDGLLNRYEHWRDHYTPLAGIAEVRAAVEDGFRLDLPMPFVPREFETLREYGFGERIEVRRERVDDLRTAVAEHRRILLLGDPGSGKTTTLWRLVYDYATTARGDGRAPLPVLIPLGGYTDDGPFDAYLARHLGPLAPYLETYRASGRLVLLLDGLNEMPQAGYAERVERIRDVLNRKSHPDEIVVITCRALDYVARLEELQKVEVLPLDEARIRTFLRKYLGGIAGERLFWIIAGGDEMRALWGTWQRAGGTWEAFWTAQQMPLNVHLEISLKAYWSGQVEQWESLRKEPPPLLVLGHNPYLLLVTAQVYVGSEGELPAHRAQLLAAFVDTLLEREKKRHRQGWIEIEQQKDGLAALAYAVQAERGRGTAVERAWAVARLCEAVPECDAERLLYLTTGATLLDVDDTTVRFHHQLLQEYFAARELGRRVAGGESLVRYWPSDRWWEPSGWEEAVILLAGMETDVSMLLEKLAVVNPVVAARCLVEGGAQAGETARRDVAMTLVARMTDGREPPVARTRASDALAKLGDPRPGVGVCPETGVPDIVWCYVPPGPFVMGDGKDQHSSETITEGYVISRYPITNAQFAAFVEAGGYRERRYWAEAERAGVWKEGKVRLPVVGHRRERPYWYGEPFDLSNHPVVGVTWYEAVAFCRWFTERLGIADCMLQIWREGKLETLSLRRRTLTVRLPSEPEWEKAARGVDGRAYPWGEEADPNRANYRDTGIGTTSAVGCFPSGASPYGVEEASGNVLEWTLSLWGSSSFLEPDFAYPYDPGNGREDLEAGGSIRHVLRGGSFASAEGHIRAAERRCNMDPSSMIYGFRVVAFPVHL